MPKSWEIKSKVISVYLYKIQKYVFYFQALMYIFLNFYQPIRSLKIIKNGNFPYILSKKNNNAITIHNKQELSILLKKMDDSVKFENDMIIIDYHNKQIKLKYFETMEIDIFLQKIYSKLPVKNRIVIDVGGNIGDSSLLYRALGSKKVIMIEPQPKFFEFAKKNIELNNELSNIEIIHAALSNEKGTFRIDHDQPIQSFQLENSIQNGIEIPKITFNEIFSNYTNSNFVLKMDCEGCEYDVILSSPDEILQKFDGILLEFHSGFQNIANRLKDLGFDIHILNSKFTPRKLYRGHLLALK